MCFSKQLLGAGKALRYASLTWTTSNPVALEAPPLHPRSSQPSTDKLSADRTLRTLRSGDGRPPHTPRTQRQRRECDTMRQDQLGHYAPPTQGTPE